MTKEGTASPLLHTFAAASLPTSIFQITILAWETMMTKEGTASTLPTSEAMRRGVAGLRAQGEW